MSALAATHPEPGEGPNKRWWGGLDGADPARQPQAPTLISCDVLASFPTLAQLADVVAARLDGREPTLIRSVASYPGFDTFPAFSVHGKGPPGEAGGPSVDPYVCTIAVQQTKAGDVIAAIADAVRARAAA